MRIILILAAAAIASSALAETAPPTERLRAEDKATTARLNRMTAHDARSVVAASDGQGRYARALADYQAARAGNDRDRAAAADAAGDYAQAQAEYRARMARWRADMAAGAYGR